VFSPQPLTQCCINQFLYTKPVCGLPHRPPYNPRTPEKCFAKQRRWWTSAPCSIASSAAQPDTRMHHWSGAAARSQVEARVSLSLSLFLSPQNSEALCKVSALLSGNHVFEHYEEETLPINVKKAPDWNKSVWSSLHHYHLLQWKTPGCARNSVSFVLWLSWSRAPMAREL